MKVRIAALITLWVTASVTVTAWAQPPVLLRSETKVVVVDAVVTDKKGAYVHDLTAKNFRVWEDNKEQTIQSFALESASGNTATAAPRVDYMVLMFDYVGMDGADQLRARQAAAKFIDANVGPNRVMAVANYDSTLRIAQSFTDNAGRLKEAVAGAKGGVVSVNNASTGTSASADLGARDRFLALKTLSSNLSSVPGRKTIILLTGSLIAGDDQKSALAGTIDACNRANVAVYPVDVRDNTHGAGFDADSLATVAGRGGGGRPTPTAIGRGGAGARGGTAGDIDQTTAADPNGASQQFLFALANGTGGFVIRNASELLSGLQKIGQEQAEYYILGYTPPDSKEGSCHALRVKVDRPGVTVRARSNYCAGKQQELVIGSASDKDLEKRSAAAQASTVAASMRLPFFYVGPNVARVIVAMEIQPDAVKFEKKKGSLHADVNLLGVASTADGDTAARFNDTLTLDFEESDQKWKEKPLHYEKEFKIAPGQYTFTIAFSSGGESFGKLEQKLVIEPHQAEEFAMSAVALAKETRKAGDAGSPLGGALFDDRTPLAIGGVNIIPTGSSVFAKTDQAFCYFEIYGSAEELPIVSIRLLNGKTGEPFGEGGARVDVTAAKATIPLGVNVPISMLAPGPYQLEVTAVDKSGKSVRRSAEFEIR